MNTNPGPGLFSLRRTLLLGVGLIALAAAALAGVGTWTSSGPPGVSIYAFAVDPTTQSRVFALGSDGVYRSSDGGANWTKIDSRTGLYALTIASSSAMYAIDFVTNRVVLSDDEGATWQTLPLDPGTNNRLYALAVDPSSSSTVYVGTSDGVLKSSDGGQTWAETSGLDGQGILNLAVDPSNPSTIYAANQDWPSGGVFKSTDAGRNWSRAGTLMEPVYCLAIVPTRPTTIYGCVQSSGVLQSNDGGATWTSILIPGEAIVHSIAIDPGNPSRIFAATYWEFFRRPDANAGWSRVQFGPEAQEDLRAAAITIVPSSPTALLVAGRNGILRSTDGGASWTVAEAGGSSSIESVAVNPSALGSVYAGGWGGVFESSNAGATWTPPDLASPETYALAVDPRNGSTVFAAGLGLSKSRDGGATWEPTGTGLPSVLLTALAISPSDSSVMLAGSVAGVLYKSIDGGQSFQQSGPVPLDDAGYPPVWRSIAFDPSNPSIAYAAGNPADYFGEHGFVQKTIDGGAHWNDLGVGGSGAFSVVVDPASPSTVYLATREGLLKSSDGGTTWIPLTGPTGALVIDPVEPATIFSGGTSGVFQSLDRGASWSPLGPGLTGEVTSLAIEPDGKRLYAGTWGSGVFDFDLSLDGQGPCEPGPGTLCLLGGRFRVTLFVTDPRRDRSSSGLAVAQGDRFGYFSLPAFTGDATLPEVFIKMVDGSWRQPGAFWVFYNGLTSLPYTLFVTDTTTGARRVYHNEGYCGAADTAAFPAESSAFPTTLAGTQPATTLSASGNELLLLDGRFRIRLSATHPRDGRVSEGSALPQGDRFGYFSLPAFTGDPNFPEVCVKMVDATSFNGQFWFFHTGLTHLPYTLTVTDTATGAVRTYQNDSTDATRLCGGADTQAFPE